MTKTLSDIFRDMAEKYPDQPQVLTIHITARCSECRSATVEVEGQLCGQCETDRARGWRVRSLAGRCANGSELDHGTRYHVLMTGKDTALCGAEPGRRSVGWSDWGAERNPTCPRCVSKLTKMERQNVTQ